MRAVWGLIFMALFVKGARTDPMPLKLQVKVLSKENQKDYRTSDLVPGFGRRRHHGPCLPLGEPCTKRGQKDNCCGGLICWGTPDTTEYEYVTTDNYRCEVAEAPPKCLKRKRRCRYAGTQDACCDGSTCKFVNPSLKRAKCG